MVQPEPYEVVHTVQEPIVTHHVSYKEALPASETIAYQSTGLGTQVVDGWQEVLPVEASHLNDPRISVDGPRPQTYNAPVVETVAYTAPVVYETAAPVVYETAPVIYETAPVIYETAAPLTYATAAPAHAVPVQGTLYDIDGDGIADIIVPRN